MAEPLVVTVDERGAIDETWTLRVTPELIEVRGELSGVVSRIERVHPLSLRGLQIAPINPVTGTPYFQCLAEDVVRAKGATGFVQFRTHAPEPVEWRKREGEASRDWGGVSPQLDLAEGQAPQAQDAAARVTEGALELYAEISGPECVTVRVSGIALADFDAVCQSVRDAFLAKVA